MALSSDGGSRVSGCAFMAESVIMAGLMAEGVIIARPVHRWVDLDGLQRAVLSEQLHAP